MLLPALSKAKAKAQSIACVNNLKQLQLAWIMYPDDHNQLLPPNQLWDGTGFTSSPPGVGSWKRSNGFDAFEYPVPSHNWFGGKSWL